MSVWRLIKYERKLLLEVWKHSIEHPINEEMKHFQD
jgi:hypothetical protein